MLKAGSRIGHYEVVSQLGAGGMGVVYRARDSKLGREVAIKVLPSDVAQDPDRLARFEREARVLASLNHTNIATLFGLEAEGDTSFLVMELVEGETLEQRLAGGALPVGEALELARQIAAALEVAHERAVIHRDLKPANVGLTGDGLVKVLDFGLAKALLPEGEDGDPTQSPTLSAATAAGTILGTAPYMSPEQARGHAVDRRTDIWAFGCVLFEMLSGQRAFPGDTVTDTLAAVIEREPDWALLPAATPRRVVELLHRCLRKDPRRRLRDAGDAGLELEPPDANASAASSLGGFPGGVHKRPRRWSIAWPLAGVLAVLLASLAAWIVLREQGREPVRVVRLALLLPDDANLVARERPSHAISPDGSKVVFVGEGGGGQGLYYRSLGELDAVGIPDTEGAVGPFFSPDGTSVGFFAEGQVRRVALGGGAAQRVCSSPPVARGAQWCGDGTILFCPNETAGLARAVAEGGPYELISEPDLEKREGGHCWPQLLPGGDFSLATVLPPGAATFDDARIVAIDLASGQQRVLVEGGSYGRYVSTGHLVFARGGSLLAVPFDGERLEVGGAPVTLIAGVLSDPTSGVAHFAISDSGTLVYATGGSRVSALRSLRWVDRSGHSQPITEELAAYGWPRPSPDGRRLAVTIEGATDDIWVLDLERGTFRRMTFQGRNLMPNWTPDGSRITYSSVRGSFPEIYTVPADGSGEAELLVRSENAIFSGSWSPDGKTLAYTSEGVDGRNDIFVNRVGQDPWPLTRTHFSEAGPRFSPDGRWLAYVSDESGRVEIYLRRFPETERTWQVSTAGGRMPVWAPSGNELFYRWDDAIYAVSVETEPDVNIGRPELLFRERFATARPDYATFDVAPDGRFVIVREAAREPGPGELIVVLNWFEELKRLVPTGD